LISLASRPAKFYPDNQYGYAAASFLIPEQYLRCFIISMARISGGDEFIDGARAPWIHFFNFHKAAQWFFLDNLLRSKKFGLLRGLKSRRRPTGCRARTSARIGTLFSDLIFFIASLASFLNLATEIAGAGWPLPSKWCGIPFILFLVILPDRYHSGVDLS